MAPMTTLNTLSEQSRKLERLREEKQLLANQIKKLTSDRNRTFRRICEAAARAANTKKTGIRAIVYKRSPNLIHICLQSLDRPTNQKGWSNEESAVIASVKQAMTAEGFDFEERGYEVYDNGTIIEWSFLL